MRKPAGAQSSGRRHGLRRFLADRRGATAVEFAIIAIPFFALITATLETAMVFFAGGVLETATQEAARLIRTGQAKERKFDLLSFRSEVCTPIRIMFDCDKLQIDVRKSVNFASINLAPVIKDGKIQDEFGYDGGAGGDIIVVRVFYVWPVFANILGHNLRNMEAGHLLSAIVAFKNEPFP